MPIISADEPFCYDKFEETPNEKVVNMSKLTKPYFKKGLRKTIRPLNLHEIPLHKTWFMQANFVQI